MARNIKGLLFGIVGTVTGYFVSQVVEEQLNKRLNPELMEERQAEWELVKTAVRTPFEITLSNDEDCEEEETSD